MHRQISMSVDDRQWAEVERRRAEASERAGYPIPRAAIIRKALAAGLSLTGADDPRTDDSNRAAER